MAETAEKRKKLYKVATELNLSHETLIEFLRKKGHEIKGHMSSLDEDMMKDILVHFKKEKDVAEKHQRKIAEIRETKKRAERKVEEVAEVPLPPPAPPPAAPEPPAAVPSPEEVPVIEEEAVPLPVESVEPEVPVPAAPAQPVEAAAPPAEPVPVREKVEVRKPRGEDLLSPLERSTARKVGLTIKGKMDLRPTKPPARAAKPGTGTAAPAAAESDEHKRKKKKKKVREDVPETKAVETDDLDRKKKKKKKIRHKEIDQAEVTDAIRRTFAAMDDTPATGRAVLKKRKKKEREEEVARLAEEAHKEEGKLRVTEFVSVNDLANLMHVNVADVIKKCMELGIMVSINQRLDKDTITLVADEFGFAISFYEEVTEEEVHTEG